MSQEKIALFGRSGAMFSNIWSVTGFVAWAAKNGFVPVVDFGSSEPANHLEGVEESNGWTDYFLPVSDVSSGDALSSSDVFHFRERPKEFPVNEYSQNDKYVDAFHSAIRLNPELTSYVDTWLRYLATAGRCLGVHARGTDMRVAKSHQAPPEHHQLRKIVDEALGRVHFDSIFVATEDARSLDFLRKRYGKTVVTTDSFRTGKKKKLVHESPGILQWKYLLGMQVVRDAWLLAACAGLVSGSSNVSEHAQVIKRNGFEVNLQIRRPRVDVFHSAPLSIAVTNALRFATTSRVSGPDFRVFDRTRRSA